MQLDRLNAQMERDWKELSREEREIDLDVPRGIRTGFEDLLEEYHVQKISTAIRSRKRRKQNHKKTWNAP